MFLIMGIFLVAGCGSDVPTREEIGASAQSTEARLARVEARQEVGRTLSGFRDLGPDLTPLAAERTDICAAGKDNFPWGHDKHRTKCTYTEVLYLAVDANLVRAVRGADEAARNAHGVLSDGDATLNSALHHAKRHGKNKGRQSLSERSLRYEIRDTDRTLTVTWSTAAELRPTPFSCVSSYEAYCTSDDEVDVDALWSGPMMNRRYLMTVATAKVYHEVPWTD